jgi:hypothetical protein
MLRPAALNPNPSALLATLGGAAGTVLLIALLFLSPALGIPFVDVPRLVGGVFTPDPAAALWLGSAVFFLGGWLVFPVGFAMAWPLLPGGAEVTFPHALVKGLLLGAILAVVSGLLLPVLGWINQLEALENPGFFALGEGVLAAAGVLLGHLLYGVAVALVAAMSRGMAPIDLLGWYEYERPGRSRGRAAASGNR